MGVAERNVYQTIEHPIDVIENLAMRREWLCERGTDDNINICLSGIRCDFHVTISWRSDLNVLHIASLMDLRIPVQQKGSIYELLALINEHLGMGHFDFWSSDGTILFRNVLMLSGLEIEEEQCDGLLNQAVVSCEQFFPAFQYVIWAGYDPKSAFSTCLFETKGEA